MKPLESLYFWLYRRAVKEARPGGWWWTMWAWHALFLDARKHRKRGNAATSRQPVSETPAATPSGASS